ncbi:MAG: LexA family transcriptional regulator [Campylobacter hyointestinalis]
MGYGNQIKAIRIEKDISRVELADMIGVSIKTMYNYENEITKISSEDLQKISNILNYNFMSSNMSSKNNKYVKQSQNLSGNKPLNTPNLKKSQDIINIPYFEDTYASAESGIINYDETPIIMSFDINFLRVFLKITGSLNNLHIINAKGDSMEPTIRGGELLYINPYENEQSVISGCIYVINYDGDIFVKRVDKNPVTKSLTLISDNPKYEPIKIEVPDLTNCKIIGRVVAHTSRI